jgi:hypothetical protein
MELHAKRAEPTHKGREFTRSPCLGVKGQTIVAKTVNRASPGQEPGAAVEVPAILTPVAEPRISALSPWEQ